MKLAVDLDGTLITCDVRQSACLRAVARSRGLDLDVGQVWRLKRRGASTRSALMKLGHSESVAAELSAQWVREVEEPYWLSLDRLCSGSYRALSDLISSGWQLSLLTARRRADLLAIQLQQLNLSRFFSDVHVVNVANPHEAKAVILARGSFHAFVGDTESDFMAARMARVPFQAVACGQRDVEFLKQFGVANPQTSFAEAVDVVLGAAHRTT